MIKIDTKKLKQTYGKRLKAIRLQRKISLTQISEETNIKKKRYLRIENGKSLATVPEMTAISLYLNVKNHYLCGLCDEFQTLN